MKPAAIVTLLCALVTACGGERRDEPAQWLVSPQAFGPIRFGVPLAGVKSALGDTTAAEPQEDMGCEYYFHPALPAGSSLMVVDDSVVRVDIDTAGIRTVAGAQVGDSESTVLALYPDRVRVEEHEYTGPEGHYLIVTDTSDSTFRLIFETWGGRVSRYRGGKRPPVDYVEGCS